MKIALILLLLPLVTAGYVPAEKSAGVLVIPALSGSANCAQVSIFHLGKPTFTLIPKEQGARTGKVWVRSGWDGICIQGEVNGAAPQWAAKPSGLLEKDHVEVWLATSPQVRMPLIGWGNQFGDAKLKSADGCAKAVDSFLGTGTVDTSKCRKWYAKQLGYRAWLRRLFVRQWVIAGEYGGSVEEEYAEQAWQTLKAEKFKVDLPVPLRPHEFDGVEASAGMAKEGYVFQIFIPYSAFPAAPNLKLSDLWLMVDVFNPAPAGRKTGPYSTTSSRRVWGEPATFNHVKLDKPVRYALSPCEAPLTEENMYGDKLPAWFFPVEPKSAKDSPVVVGKDFVLANPAGGYLYQPGGMSPEVDVHEHFWKKLGAGEWVCGPHMGFRRAGVTHWAVPVKTQHCTMVSISAHSITRNCWMKGTSFDLDKRGFDARAIGDGIVLVRSGPYSTTLSAFGSGMCGLCTVANLDFYTISQEGKAGKALELNPVLSGMGDEPMGADFSISPDWKTVTEFDRYDGKSGWTSTKYCFDGTMYKKCGGSSDANPPNPPHYPQYAPPPD